MLGKVSKKVETLYYQLCVCLGEENLKVAETNMEKRPYLRKNILQQMVYDNNFQSIEEFKEYIEQVKRQLGITGKDDVGCSDKVEVEKKLGLVYSELKKIEEENLEKIKSISPEFERIFIKYLPADASIEDKINFLAQYISRTVTYSEDWFNYSFRVKAGINGSLTLKDSVPILPTEDEIIVLGQGICGDISALAERLGTKIGLDIGTEMVEYKTFGHGLNIVKLSNGKYSNVDITRLIRGDKTPSQCILVANDVLLSQEYEGLHNGNKPNEETETVSREYVETFYEKHKNVIDKMVEDTLELRNRVVNNSSFDFPLQNNEKNEEISNENEEIR